MAEVGQGSSHVIEHENVGGLHIEMHDRTAVHERQAEDELRKKSQQRGPPSRRVLQPIVLEPSSFRMQALRRPLQNQARPAQRARDNGESSNDVGVLAQGRQHGELLLNVDAGCCRLQPPAFRQLHGYR